MKKFNKNIILSIVFMVILQLVTPLLALAEAGAIYVDLSGKNDEVTIDENGNGIFTVGPGQVTYWANKESLDNK